jgi:hypothetical protein
MSKIRILAVAFFAVFAFSAIAAGSAQAGWLVLGSLLVGSAAISSGTVVDKEGVLEYEVEGSKVKIGCTNLTVSGGKISEPDKFLATSLEFNGCVETAPANCSLSNTNVGTLPVEGLVTLDGPLATKAKVKPENPSALFATFKIEGVKCSLAGKEAVTGSASVLDPEGQDERLWHLLNALVETAGELKVGSASASISGSALFKLESNMLWSFD